MFLILSSSFFFYPKHRMVFFLNGQLIIRVLETQFPGGHHMEKTSHQT